VRTLSCSYEYHAASNGIVKIAGPQSPMPLPPSIPRSLTAMSIPL
jgi:hypothetical protein